MRHDSASLFTRCWIPLLISKTSPSTSGTSMSPLMGCIMTNCTSFSTAARGTMMGTWMRCPCRTHPPLSVCLRIFERGFMHANCSRMTCRMWLRMPKWSSITDLSTGSIRASNLS